MATAITVIPFQGPIIDFRGLLTDAIKGAPSELGLNSFDYNPDPSVSGWDGTFILQTVKIQMKFWNTILSPEEPCDPVQGHSDLPPFVPWSSVLCFPS